MYHYGDSLEKDWKEAQTWLMQAANLDYQPAHKLMGDMYLSGGNGIEKDYSKALEWYEKAGDEYFMSLYGRGLIYQKGDEKISRDYQRSAQLFEKSLAIQEYPSTFESLGVMYRYGGYGLSKNTNKAIGYFKEANTGFSSFQLYKIYSGRKQYKTGSDWLLKAIEQGNEDAIDEGVKLLASTMYYYKNDFSKEDKNYYDYTKGDKVVKVEYGRYSVKGENGNAHFDWVNHSGLDVKKDYTISVKTKAVYSGSKKGSAFGLVFEGEDTKNFKAFVISEYGGANFYNDENGKDQNNDGWQSNVAKKNDWNTLKVSRKGSYFELYVNDNFVKKYYAPKSSSKRIGLYYSNDQKVYFDDLLISGAKI